MKPKETNNKSQTNSELKDELNISEDLNKSNNLDCELRPCNGESTNVDRKVHANDKLCNLEENSLNEDSENLIENNLSDDELNKKSNRILFSIFTQSKLRKGQRFGPYLIQEKETNLEEENSKDQNLKDHLKDKENQFNQIANQLDADQIKRIKEPAGFWLKIIRNVSTNEPTAFIQIQGKIVF